MTVALAERTGRTHGWVAPGFEEVRVEFERNFAERGEIGAAVAAYGGELGVTPATFASLTAPPEFARPMDEVLGVPSWYSLGYLRPGPELGFGASQRAFGTPGAGGSFAFADPDARLGYAYVMNKMDFHMFDDPREKPLRDAVHRAINRLSAR